MTTMGLARDIPDIRHRVIGGSIGLRVRIVRQLMSYEWEATASACESVGLAGTGEKVRGNEWNFQVLFSRDSDDALLLRSYRPCYRMFDVRSSYVLWARV